VSTFQMNNWTPQAEAEVKYIGDCARGYLWMYKQDTRYYTKVYQYFSNTIIFMSVVGPAIAILGVGFGGNFEKVLVIIGIVTGFFVGISESILRKCEFESKIGDLKRQSARFSGLVNNIRRQLSTIPEQRENASSYQTWIAKNYDDLVELSMDITEGTQKDYETVAKENSLPFPDAISELSSIKIFTGKEVKEEEVKEEVIDGGKMKLSIPPSREAEILTPHVEKESSFSDEKEKSVGDVGDATSVHSNSETEKRRPSIIIRPPTFRGKKKTLTPDELATEGIGYTDDRMKYELERLSSHGK